MSKPTFTSRGTVYDFVWAQEEIAIQVSRIKEHSRDGRTTAELKIITTKDIPHPHLHQAQFNLTSSQARTSLAKLMIEKYN